MARSIYRRNPLAYPGGPPGFDPSHPAANVGAGGYTLSVSAQVAPGQELMHSLCPVNYRNFTGGGGAGPGLDVESILNSGTSVPVIDGRVGPALDCTNGGSARFYCPGTTYTQNTQTAACIFVATLPTNGNFWPASLIIPSSGSAALFQLSGDFAGTFYYGFSGNNATSGLPLVVYGVPYFIAASAVSSGTINLVLRRLDTGQVWTFTSSIGALSDPTTIVDFNFGAFVNGGNAGNQIAAGLVSNAEMSMPQLKAWADDPWSFWYPQTYDPKFSALVAPAGGSGTTISASAGNFTITGEPTAIAVALAAASGSFTINGQSAAIATGLLIAGSPGSFTITGQPTSLAETIAASAGAFTLSGQPASLAQTIAAAGGSYTLTGQASALNETIAALKAIFSINGQAATISETGNTVAFDVGHLTISGQPVVITLFQTVNIHAPSSFYHFNNVTNEDVVAIPNNNVASSFFRFNNATDIITKSQM